MADIETTVNHILSFIGKNETELNVNDPALAALIFHALIYLHGAERIETIAQQKQFLKDILVPMEQATDGKYSFVLEHELIGSSSRVSAPTIQISTTGGKFHALIIKRQDLPLGGYDTSMGMDTFDNMSLQVAIAKDRVREMVDLETEFPQLAAFREQCKETATPIVYFLGRIRNYLDPSSERALQIIELTKNIDTVFSEMENAFGNNVVIGTGGWAGVGEKSLGVPRMGYLRALHSGVLTLTTMPHIGKYDRHQEVSCEVFCGEEWGDDSAALAAACDAAVIFCPFGTWTKIELANLQAQGKLIAVVDDPREPTLAPGEGKKEIATEYGSYWMFSNPKEAGQYLTEELKKRDFKKGPPFNLKVEPHSIETAQYYISLSGIHGHSGGYIAPQELHKLKIAQLQLMYNLPPLPGDIRVTENYMRDAAAATTQNALILILTEYIDRLARAEQASDRRNR